VKNIYYKGFFRLFSNTAKVGCKEKGILLMILASIFFALLAVMVRKLSQELPTFEILFFQCLPSIILMPFLLRKNKIVLIGKNKFALFFRGGFSFFSLVFYYYALQKMNIASAVTLLQLSPFFIIILSALFLKEKISKFQIPITILAFSGALLIIKPGFGFNYLPAIFCVLAALFGSSGQALVRHLRLTDHPFVVMNYLFIIMAFLSLSFQLLSDNFVIPEISMILDLIILGLIYFFGQLSLTLAYFHLPASLVSLYKYSQIIFAIILGFIFFYELPDIFSLLGAIIIVISGFLNYKSNSNQFIQTI